MYAKVPPRSKSSTSSQLHSQTSFGSSSFSVQRQAKKAKGSKGIPIQAKLTIGEPGDKYEQEADRVAAQVVNQINAPVTQQQSQNLQREATLEEDELQMKSEVDTIQRKEIIEEEELQMKPTVQLQAGAGGMTATPDLEKSIQQARGGGQPLADNVRKPMEQAFGADFSRVKVHTDSQADQLNRATQARAFTTGQDVFFRQGEYNPGSRGGQELIAHELTHVVQQGGHGSKSIQRVVEVVGDAGRLPDQGQFQQEKELHIFAHTSGEDLHTIEQFADNTPEDYARILTEKYPNYMYIGDNNYSKSALFTKIWLHGCNSQAIAKKLKNALEKIDAANDAIEVFGTTGISATSPDGKSLWMIPMLETKNWLKFENEKLAKGKANKDGISEWEKKVKVWPQGYVKF